MVNSRAKGARGERGKAILGGLMNIKQQLELVKAERDKWKAVAEYRQKLIEKMEGENDTEIRNPRQAARPE